MGSIQCVTPACYLTFTRQALVSCAVLFSHDINKTPLCPVLWKSQRQNVSVQETHVIRNPTETRVSNSRCSRLEHVELDAVECAIPSEVRTRSRCWKLEHCLNGVKWVGSRLIRNLAVWKSTHEGSDEMCSTSCCLANCTIYSQCEERLGALRI